VTPQAKLISRLLNVYGEPKCDDPGAYIEEFELAITGYAGDVLDQAGNEIVKRCTFWPRPAEVVAKIEAILIQREARKPPKPKEPDYPPPTPEQRERARKILAMGVAAMRSKAPRPAEPPPLPDVSRPAFEAMQQSSHNRYLHEDHSRRLTQRITGERDE